MICNSLNSVFKRCNKGVLLLIRNLRSKTATSSVAGASSETQGQSVGAGTSLNGREKIRAKTVIQQATRRARWKVPLRCFSGERRLWHRLGDFRGSCSLHLAFLRGWLSWQNENLITRNSTVPIVRSQSCPLVFRVVFEKLGELWCKQKWRNNLQTVPER